VPNQCAAEGGSSLSRTSWSFGSKGAIHGAAIAIATIVTARTRPTTSPPERVARFQAEGAVTVAAVALLIGP
jgi:hypothetical protein